VQISSKRATSRATSQEEIASDDNSSGGDDQFVISPQPRRTVWKARVGVSSSRATEEAANMAEGHAVREAREARARDEVQKVERSLRSDYEYTLRRVDRRHPHRPTDFTLGGNQSIVNNNENPFDWTTELHDHRFWNNFHADWYLIVIKERNNPITP
jgi:hypothetical protein